jgi:hypothetical protein
LEIHPQCWEPFAIILFVPNMVGISYSKPWVGCTLDEDLEAYVWFCAKHDTIVFVCVRFVLVLTRYSLFHPIIN